MSEAQQEFMVENEAQVELKPAVFQYKSLPMEPVDIPVLGEAYTTSMDDLQTVLEAAQAQGFNFLFDLFGIDTGSGVEVVYALRRMDDVYDEVFIKVSLPYGATLKSMWKLYHSALMAERELCEMFDLYLAGHPNPKRLLTTDGCPPYLLKSTKIRTPEEAHDRTSQYINPQQLDRTMGSLAPLTDEQKEALSAQLTASEEESAAYQPIPRPKGPEFFVELPSVGSSLEDYCLKEHAAGIDQAEKNPDGVEAERILLNMGPQHPSTHGVLRVLVELDGEEVVTGEAVIGQLHRGIEKLAEHRQYHAIGTLMDRGDYISGIHNELAVALATEKLAEIEVPRRANYLRCLTGELNRIASHMVWLGPSALDAGMMGLFLYLWKDRENILDILEDLTGQRMMFNYVRPGGVKGDMTPRAAKLISEFIDGFTARLDEHEAYLMENDIFKGRTIGVGHISKEMALSYGLTGANLRASGASWDVRRDRPYAAYNELQFAVPISHTGDIYARTQVRIQEMRQAAAMAKQCLEGLPEGDIMAKMPKSLKPPKGEAYACVESPRGELGAYIVSDGKAEPYRMRYRPPAFYALQAGESLIPGTLIADAVVTLGSLDFVLGEIDR